MNRRPEREAAKVPEDLARLLVTRQRAGDAQGMAELYEADAVMDAGDGRLLRGSAQIQAFYETLVGGAKFELGIQRLALINGDLALTSTTLPSGAVTAEIARRQPDGSWLWWIDQPTLARLAP